MSLFRSIALAVAPALAFVATPAAAQMQTVDPDAVIDGDLLEAPAAQNNGLDYGETYAGKVPDTRYDSIDPYEGNAEAQPDVTGEQPGFSEAFDQTYIASADPDGVVSLPEPGSEAASDTYAEDDLIGAAEGLFGRGAEGLARLIQDVLADQGEPNGYIVGREAGGAFVLGVRYGSGTLFHKVEGNFPVYWTGPSIGFDLGANAGNTFVLVYNLHNTDELYRRFPAGEGQAYFVGGFTASYVRRGDVVMIPIRVGAGLR
ncbi:MAG: EipA family protein, partial [Alteraurantiacibacter sp.]